MDDTKTDEPESEAPAGLRSGFSAKGDKSLSPAKIDYDDFKKLDLRVAKIIEAEKVENSENLLKIKVTIGDEERQIVSGISKYYNPEDLVGKEVIIVVNLKYRKFMGVESQGMLLAAEDADGSFSLLTVDKTVTPGGKVS